MITCHNLRWVFNFEGRLWSRSTLYTQARVTQIFWMSHMLQFLVQGGSWTHVRLFRLGPVPGKFTQIHHQNGHVKNLGASSLVLTVGSCRRLDHHILPWTPTHPGT